MEEGKERGRTGGARGLPPGDGRAGPAVIQSPESEIPGTGSCDPVAATTSAIPGTVALGTYVPAAPLILTVMLGALGRRHLTRRSATLIHCHLPCRHRHNGRVPKARQVPGPGWAPCPPLPGRPHHAFPMKAQSGLGDELDPLLRNVSERRTTSHSSFQSHFLVQRVPGGPAFDPR